MLEVIFGSVLFNVFLFAGGIASVISLLLGLKKYRRPVLIVHVILVVALSVFSSYSYFSTRAIRDVERVQSARKERARQDAAMLLSGLPSNINYYKPGEGRGVALAGLSFLEQHRDLYPATFELAQSTVRVDIEAAQKAPDTSEERNRMETAGVAMLNILRGIAAGASK
jgi:hypothetical protein